MKLPGFSAVSAVALLVAACGNDNDTAQAPATIALAGTAAAVSPNSASGPQFNSSDVAFAQSMIPHHQQVTEMAELALDPARQAGGTVRDLAERIQAAQEPEIEQLTSWLSDWGQPIPSAVPDMGTMAGMHDNGTTGMPGMVAADEEDHLRSLTAAEFDTMWREMMIRHHQRAVAMARVQQQTQRRRH